MENWVAIDDTKIRHCWECKICGEMVFVPSWEYQNIGTPYCADCDEDMAYVRTEINDG